MKLQKGKEEKTQKEVIGEFIKKSKQRSRVS